MVRVYFFILLGFAVNSQAVGQSENSTTTNFLSTLLKSAGYSHTADELSSSKFYLAEFLESDYPFHNISKLQLSNCNKANLVRVPKLVDDKNVLCKEYLVPSNGNYIKLLKEFYLTKAEFENHKSDIQNSKLFFIQDTRLYKVGFLKNGMKDSTWITNFEDYPLPSFEFYKNGKSTKGFKSFQAHDDKGDLWASGKMYSKPSINQGIKGRNIGEVTFYRKGAKMANRVFYRGGEKYSNEGDSLLVTLQFGKGKGPVYLHWFTELSKEVKNVDSVFYALKGFKKFESRDIGVSFFLPEKWEFKSDGSGSGFDGHFISTDTIEMETFNDCHDSLIFRISSYNLDLDSSLKECIFAYERNGKYFTDLGHVPSEKEIEIRTIGDYQYVRHINNCKIFCKEDGFSTLVECETVLISNGTKTIELHTSSPFEQTVFETILKSINFKNKSFKQKAIADYTKDVKRHIGPNEKERLYLIQEDFNLDGKKDILISGYYKGAWGNAGGEWTAYFQTDIGFRKCPDITFMNHEAAKFDSISGYIRAYSRINAIEGSYSERKLSIDCSDQIKNQKNLSGEEGGDIRDYLRILWSDKKNFQVQTGTVDSKLNIVWGK